MSAKFEVGQKVIVFSGIFRGKKVSESTINKVARKYVYIDGRSTGFDPETGFEASDPHGNGTRIWTIEDWAERQETIRLNDELREAGLNIRSGAKFTNAQLARIITAATTED